MSFSSKTRRILAGLCLSDKFPETYKNAVKNYKPLDNKLLVAYDKPIKSNQRNVHSSHFRAYSATLLNDKYIVAGPKPCKTLSIKGGYFAWGKQV